MLRDFSLTVVLALCVILAACSGTPRAAGPATTVATTAAPAASNLPTVNAQSAPPASDVDPSLLKAGYRLLRRNNLVLYCRSETITGQRIATQVCLSAAQIQTEKQNVTKAKDLMSQGGNRCVKPACE